MYKNNMEIKRIKRLLLIIVIGLLIINYYVPFQNVRCVYSGNLPGNNDLPTQKIIKIIAQTKEFGDMDVENKDKEEHIKENVRKVASDGNLTQRVNRLKSGEQIIEEKIKEITQKTPMEKSWAEKLVDKSQKYEIDVYLLLGLIRVESVFDPENVSSAGAIGIMQLMPETANFLARMQDVEYSRQKLFDPCYNIKLGTAYIDYLLELYDNNVDRALTAYNRGEGGLETFERRAGTPESAFSRMVKQKAEKYEEKIDVSEVY